MRRLIAIAAVVFAAASLLLGAEATQPSTPSTQPSTQPKELTLDLGNHATMKLVLIRPGKFLMGSPAAEQDRSRNEGPQHEVAISKAFYMGAMSVTQGQWKAVMGSSPWQGQANVQLDDNNAANFVSWNDAAEFCKRLSAKSGKTVSLPTEAQWEYACRAGTQTRFYYGDDPDYSHLGDYAWWAGNSWDIGEKYPHAVGRKKPNAWGLYDMHGNVWSWCLDWSAPFAADAATDPTGPATGAFHVERGGSYNLEGRVCRAACRTADPPGKRLIHIGFRVVAAGD